MEEMGRESATLFIVVLSDHKQSSRYLRRSSSWAHDIHKLGA